MTLNFVLQKEQNMAESFGCKSVELNIDHLHIDRAHINRPTVHIEPLAKPISEFKASIGNLTVILYSDSSFYTIITVVTKVTK